MQRDDSDVDEADEAAAAFVRGHSNALASKKNYCTCIGDDSSDYVGEMIVTGVCNVCGGAEYDRDRE